MNVTYLEFIQALIESIGVISCLISATVLIFSGLNKTTRELKNMYFALAIMLVCDGCAYIFRGNTDVVSVVLTRIVNYGNFLMYDILLVVSARLIEAEKSGEASIKGCSVFLKVIYALGALGCLTLIVNLFSKFMFYFDADNYYHRNTGWYIFNVIVVLGVIISIIYILRNHREFGTSLTVYMIIYEMFPLVLAVIQSLFYGVSISVVGIEICAVGTMYTFFFSVEAVRFTSSDKPKRKGNYPLWIYTANMVLIVSISAAYVFCINAFVNEFSRLGIEKDGFSILQNLWPSLIIFYAALIILQVQFFIMFGKEWWSRKQSEENRLASILDELTGALNRRAYERQLEKELSEDEERADFAVVVFDINGLKSANDVLGHKAGDELIKGAAECIHDVFDRHGNIYRIGGDEFAALVHFTKEQQTAAFDILEKKCADWKHPLIKELSISKGCARASEYPNKTIGELVKVADQFMYADKDAYYVRTGKERRKG